LNIMGNCLEPKNKSVKEPIVKASNENNSENNTVTSKKASTGPKSWDVRRQKLNPKDYQFANKTNETLVKPPGSINGEQFVIDTCQNCNIYICDYSATVLIDDCENCKFYIGPCVSSVFVRTVKDSQFVVACQQFRTRVCENLDIIIFSQTPPIIESSKNLRFGCFKFGYFELQQQFQKAELNVWNNRWSEVYDFTKKETKNFSFLPEDVNPYNLVPQISSLSGGEFSDPSSEQVDLLVPITVGDRTKLFDQEILVILLPGYENAAEHIIPELNHQKDYELIRSRAISMTNDHIQQLPSNDQLIIKKLISTQEINVGKDVFIFMYFGGKELEGNLYHMLERVLTNKKCYHIWNNSKAVTDLSKFVFETWREGE